MRTCPALLVILIFLLYSLTSQGVAETGKAAAAKYFQAAPVEDDNLQTSREALPQRSYSRQLAISAGTFFSTRSYQWLGEDISGWAMQVDYRAKTAPGDFFAQGFRLGLEKFQNLDQSVAKLSALWSITFPAKVTFPVYLGGSAGPGFFLRQKEDESWLTVDYQGFLGLRLNGEHSQFFVEGGVKNHLLVLSNGQFSGWFMASGVAYKF